MKKLILLIVPIVSLAAAAKGPEEPQKTAKTSECIAAAKSTFQTVCEINVRDHVVGKHLGGNYKSPPGTSAELFCRCIVIQFNVAEIAPPSCKFGLGSFDIKGLHSDNIKMVCGMYEP